MEHRPWGWMVKFFHFESMWLKFLRVKGRTSLQTHKHRTEWHIGLYRIDPGDIHRMQKGFFFELALGRPNENDIERLEDDYKRVN